MTEEFEGQEPTLVIEDEINDVVQLSELLEQIELDRRRQRRMLAAAPPPMSMKINDKADRRAKSKNARKSRRKNRG